MKRAWVAFISAALLSGCMTSRSWDQPGSEVLGRQVKPADRVLIVARNGNTYQFDVTVVADDALHGRDGRKRYRVMHDMIESIEVQRTHQWPGVVLGIFALGLVGNLFLCNDQDLSVCIGE